MNTWQTPEKIALVTDDETLTYEELDANINSLSYGMRQVGVKKGSKVGFLFKNGREFVEIYYSCLKLGTMMAPFNFRCNAEEIADMIRSVGCAFFIYDAEFSDVICEAKKSCPGVIWIENSNGEANDFADLYDRDQSGFDFYEDMDCKDEVLTIFTGGTTGKSKGAIHTHEGVAMQILPRIIDYTREDVYLISAPMFHIGGMSAMQAMLTIGGKLIVKSGFAPDDIMHTIETERVTQMFLIPPNICKRFKSAASWGKSDLRSVNLVRVGGGVNTPEITEEIFSVFPCAKVLNTYNSSEFISPIHMAYDMDMLRDNPKLLKALGRPSYSAKIKILDDELAEVPAGESGELWAKCWGTMSRYLDHDIERLDGYVPSGDIVKMDEDGYVYFLGRKKDIIKSGGENIYALEVENAIMSHSSVFQCAVIGLPDICWGEIVAAVVVTKPGVSLSEKDIIEHCKTKLSRFKKPKKVFFLDSIPTTTLGKVNKVALKKTFS